MFQLYVYMQLYFMFQLWNRCCFTVLHCSGTACSSCHLPLMIKWLPASSRFRTFCTLNVLPKCRHIIPVLCSLHWLEVTKPYRIQTPVTRTVLTTGGSALFRQAVFQYGTIPPTRLFNYQFLILVYKQMFTITSFALLPICWNYFVSTKSIRYFSIRHNQWRRKQFESGGTWRARSASV